MVDTLLHEKSNFTKGSSAKSAKEKFKAIREQLQDMKIPHDSMRDLTESLLPYMHTHAHALLNTVRACSLAVYSVGLL